MIFENFLKSLENRNQFERAACLAILTNNYEQALEMLENASKTDNRFGCLWIAVKYFYVEQNQQTKEGGAPQKYLSKQHSSSSMSSYSSAKINSPVSSLNSISSPNNKSSVFHSVSMSTKTVDSLNETIIEECNKIIENFDNSYLKALFSYVLNKDEALMKILVI